jgi:hypothetical protein
MKKSYYSSDDPERCESVQIQRTSGGRVQQKLKCHKKALWQVGMIRLCYTCFEHYLATHDDIDLGSAIRLSDSEKDFVEHHVARRAEPDRQYPQGELLCPQSRK